MAHTNCSSAVKSWRALVTAAALIQLLAGCATTGDCDPARDQGFASTFACTFSSDGYKKRVEERQLTITEGQRAAQQLAAEGKTVDANIEATEKQLYRARKKSERVDRQLHKVDASLRRAQ
jgi:septal ring factor EnvC (AmiA/AmiB activator)